MIWDLTENCDELFSSYCVQFGLGSTPPKNIVRKFFLNGYNQIRFLACKNLSMAAMNIHDYIIYTICKRLYVFQFELYIVHFGMTYTRNVLFGLKNQRPFPNSYYLYRIFDKGFMSKEVKISLIHEFHIKSPLYNFCCIGILTDSFQL